jgi:hypothetical protein
VRPGRISTFSAPSETVRARPSLNSARLLPVRYPTEASPLSNESGDFASPPPSVDLTASGSFLPGDFEQQYEELFAEALEEGEISREERHRLDLAAAALGLDADRVRRLENALLAAYEGHAAITLVDRADPSGLADREPQTAKPDTITDGDEDDRPTPVTLHTPIPDENALLHERFSERELAGDRDAQLCTAAVLVRRNHATPEEARFYETHRPEGTPRPTQALSADDWGKLFHPDEDRCTGDVFAIIASAALLGRVSAMRRDKSLPYLDAEKRQDPHSSTVSAVRAVAWSAATLGLRLPPVYVDPNEPIAFEIVPALPPALRIGASMLSGHGAVELAFHCGRNMTWFREEHFVCTLVPTIGNLEELFLAAMSIGAPHIELLPDVRKRIALVAEAIVPVLDEPKLDKLRRQVARFLARGGRTSLRRWAQAAEWTSLRAGLLLCGDLTTACDAIAPEANAADRTRELERFWASDDATYLRAKIGVAIG